VFAPAFAAEGKMNLLGPHAHVPVVHRRQAVGSVLPRVFIVADADQRGLQQAHHRRQHFLTPHPAQRQVALHPAADMRQRLGEGHHAREFVFVPLLPPLFVIAVLLAPACVAARRLDVAVVVRANPDLRPRRRDGQTLDSLQRLGIVHGPPAVVEVRKAVTIPAAAKARPFVIGIPQPGMARLGGQRGDKGVGETFNH
jgi:hypothetical protein